MAISLDITARRLVKIKITIKPPTQTNQSPVLDGDASQLLDGDGNPVFGWVEE